MHLDESVLSSPVWLTLRDVTTRLQIDRKTVYYAVRHGQLRAVQIGGRGDYRFKPEWVEAWLATCETTGGRR